VPVQEDAAEDGDNPGASGKLKEPDDPNGWEAHYEVFAVEGDRGVATGTSHYYATTYRPERIYYNCFLMRFDAEGTCAEFTEYFMAVPD